MKSPNSSFEIAHEKDATPRLAHLISMKADQQVNRQANGLTELKRMFTNCKSHKLLVSVKSDKIKQIKTTAKWKLIDPAKYTQKQN